MPKRPVNMIQRKDRPGWWFRGKLGGRIRQRFLSHDFETAKQKLRSLTDEDAVQVGPLTVHAAAERWLAKYVASHRKDLQKATQRVRDYLAPSLGRMPLRNLRRAHLREYRLVLERTHLSQQTVAHVLSDVRCLLNWCEDEGLMGRAPIPRKLLPRIDERPPDRLTEDQVAKVVALPEPYGFTCRFLLATGIRWSEAVRAQASDVQDGQLVVSKTKSGKVRRVPLSPEILAELQGRVGRLVGIVNAQTLALQVRELAELDSFHVHQCRHTFGCRWLERGGSLAALQDVLGHASIVTTQRYARLGEAHVRAEAARVFAAPSVTRAVTRTPRARLAKAR